jgi:hypothetical protein
VIGVVAAIVVDAPTSLQASGCRVNSASHGLKVNALKPRSKRMEKATLPRSGDGGGVSLPRSALPMGTLCREAKPNRDQVVSPAVSLTAKAVLMRTRESHVRHARVDERRD